MASTILSAVTGPLAPCRDVATSTPGPGQPCPRPTPSPAVAEVVDPGTAFVLRIENDSIRFIGSADDSYTQGLSLHVTRKGQWGFLRKPLDWVAPGGSDRGSSFTIGQTIFTPHNIVTYAPAPGDRPFAGYLWVGAASSATRRRSPANPLLSLAAQRARRVSLEVDAGLVGPWAGAHTAQAAFHVLRESRIPKGWDTQLANRPQINGILRLEDQWVRAERCVTHEGIKLPRTWFDLTTDARLAAGTTQSYAALGGTVRFSLYDLQTFPATSIPFAVAQASPPPTTTPEFGFSVVVGGEVRGLANNKFLDAPDIDPRHLLTEWRFGLELWWRHWQLSYLQVNRSREFESYQPLPDRHSFATIQISRAYAWKETPEGLDWLKGVRANLRLGRGRSGLEPGVPADPHISLAASWGVEVPVWRRLVVSWEKTGVAREQGPPGASACDGVPAPCHEDTFLLDNAFALGLELLPKTSRFGAQVRGGLGPGRIKHQELPDTGSLYEPNHDTFAETTHGGLGKLVGARLSWRVGHHLSLALDGTWTDMSSGGPPRVDASSGRRLSVCSFTRWAATASRSTPCGPGRATRSGAGASRGSRASSVASSW